MTLKADTGYDAPWVVFKGNSAAEVADLIGQAEHTGLYAIVGNARAAFAAQGVAGQHLGAQPVTHPATAQAEYGQPQAPQVQPQQPYSAPQGGYQQPTAQQYPAQPQGPQNGAQQAPPGQPPAPKVGTPLAVPPGAIVPTCPHGTKTLLSGTWGPFWACPARRDDPSKCKAEKFKG